MTHQIFTIACLLSLISFASVQLHAEMPTPEPREARMLMQMLRMNDAELAKLRETVERIEAMNPEERARMREQLKELRKMKPEEQARLREKVEAIPEADRQKMRERWQQMSPEERREWRQKLKDLTPEERRAAMEDVGMSPGKKRQPTKDAPADTEAAPRKGPPPPLGK